MEEQKKSLTDELNALHAALRVLDQRRKEIVVRTIKIEGVLEYLSSIEDKQKEPENAP